MGVAQEHRYVKLVREQNDEVSRRQRELEATFMKRGPRQAPVKPSPSATRRQVRTWMRLNASDYETATNLAEAANAALALPSEAMDDETHWMWEEALAALDWIAA